MIKVIRISCYRSNGFDEEEGEESTNKKQDPDLKSFQFLYAWELFFFKERRILLRSRNSKHE